MIQRTHVLCLGLFAALCGVTGCASMDKLASHMDMAVSHIAEGAKPEFEGRLSSLQVFGAMTAIQFSDGRIFDVVDVPPGLLRGDVIRIYKTEKGLVAHLWHRDNTDQVSFNAH